MRFLSLLDFHRCQQKHRLAIRKKKAFAPAILRKII